MLHRKWKECWEVGRAVKEASFRLWPLVAKCAAQDGGGLGLERAPFWTEWSLCVSAVWWQVPVTLELKGTLNAFLKVLPEEEVKFFIRVGVTETGRTCLSSSPSGSCGRKVWSGATFEPWRTSLAPSHQLVVTPLRERRWRSGNMRGLLTLSQWNVWKNFRHVATCCTLGM